MTAKITHKPFSIQHLNGTRFPQRLLSPLYPLIAHRDVFFFHCKAVFKCLNISRFQEGKPSPKFMVQLAISFQDSESEFE
jgi:hypothetical protein